MSLWVDKYRPSSLARLDYHKEQAAQLRNLVSRPAQQLPAQPGEGKGREGKGREGKGREGGREEAGAPVLARGSE
jgi:hypothetical protein